VIEKKMFSNTEDLLPVISFNAKASGDDQKKHQNFVNRMIEKGYTEKQVRLLCEWYLRVRKSSLTTRRPAGGYAKVREARMVRIIDRRFDSKNKSAVNRQRFMRRFKGQIREAVADAISGRGIKDLDNGEKRLHSRQGFVRAPISPWPRRHLGNRLHRQRPVLDRRPGQPPTGRRRRGIGQGQGQQGRRRRGRLRLQPVPRGVPRCLLRRPGAAQSGQDPARPHPGIQEPARRLHQ
jgi:hypothetical protein